MLSSVLCDLCVSKKTSSEQFGTCFCGLFNSRDLERLCLDMKFLLVNFSSYFAYLCSLLCGVFWCTSYLYF